MLATALLIAASKPEQLCIARTLAPCGGRTRGRAGICEGRHTHPGIQTAYVLEGEGVSEIDGRPDRPVKAGDAIQIPANVPHNLCAAASGIKALAVYVIEKGKPLASPSP